MLRRYLSAHFQVEPSGWIIREDIPTVTSHPWHSPPHTGSLIGWVPRTDNDRFQSQNLMFGRIDHIGAAQGSDNLGAMLVVRPSMMPAHVSPFPWQLIPSQKRNNATTRVPLGSRLKVCFDPPVWQRLSQEAEQLAHGRCEVTGASKTTAGTSLEFIPVWMYNDDKKTVSLDRLSLVCEEVALASRALDLPPASADWATAMSALMLINHWGSDEAQDHFNTAKNQRDLMLEGAWTCSLQKIRT